MQPSTTPLITSNEEMEHIMKIVKPLKTSELLIKGISKIIQNEIKEQKGRFLMLLFVMLMLLRTLAASILGNVLAGKGVIRTGEGTIRVGQNV